MMFREVVMLLLAVLLPGFSHCFLPNLSFDDVTVTHQDITERAILRKTAEVCRDIATAQGEDFNLNIDDTLTVNSVLRACFGNPGSTSPISTDAFQKAITTIMEGNARVDFKIPLLAEDHFDNEAFQQGRILLIIGLSIVKANVQTENFETAREAFGQICHTLQDFYSHSNWVELGRTTPYSTLIRGGEPLDSLAGPDVATCRSCVLGVCNENILPEVLSQGLITSGYFEIFSSTKPAGKCSHGGAFDRTSNTEPVGGINKDTVSSEHGALHLVAANLAVDATLELLEDIRLASGDRNFLRFMGLTQSSALCFVIDTTGSMSDDIDAVKQVTADIIGSRRGSSQEPSEYILVPFNDPEFGPATSTTDADLFIDIINSLTARGGGDLPELSLSGLQLALTTAPPSTEMFLFTDAPAKDVHLRSSVLALLQSTQSVVNFMLTDVLSSGRRRRRSDGQNVGSRALGQVDVRFYEDISQASGGQIISVSKLDLPQATAVIEDLSTNAVVTVFQVAINSGQPGKFMFAVDASISNMVIYITGEPSLTFNLTSPSGVSQMSTEPNGSLATIISVGNLRRIRLNSTNDIGLWEVCVNSESSYTVRVTGQSSVNFVYNLVEEKEGISSGVDFIDGRPSTGSNATFLITITGSDTATVTDVTLVDSSVPMEINGSVQSLGRGNYLIRFKELPAGEFSVVVMGEDTSSTSRSTTSRFQRQASTKVATSSLSVAAQANSSNIEPGSTVSIPFTVTSNVNGTFAVQVNNDRNYDIIAPANVTITEGEANDTVTLTVPASAASGTDVTLTIQVENTAATELNFLVLRFSVVARAADISGPICGSVEVFGICPSSPSLCASSTWEFMANLTNGVNGTGIDRITITPENGTLNTSTVVGAEGENVTVASYNGSCCSQTVTLAAIDQVGNVGRCVVQARMLTTPTPMTTFNTTTTNLTTSSCRRNTFNIAFSFWISVVLSLIIWK